MTFPKKGDIVIVDAEPHASIKYGDQDNKTGNNRRYMVIMSSNNYNRSTGTVLAMPITTSNRYQNNPRYYPILIMDGVKGYVALWQLQNFDYQSRNGKVINKITDKQYHDILPYVKDMLGI